MKKALMIGMLLLLVSTSMAWAAPVAQEIYYIKQTALAPGDYVIRFSLWDDPVAGVMVWSEEKLVTMTVPKVMTYLGDTTSLAGVDFSQQLYVQVEKKKRSGYKVIGARDRLGVVPYALWGSSGSGGGIAGVTAGPGLSGGGTSGNATLSINFAGTGAADTSARSDHNHDSQYVNASGDDMSGMLAWGLYDVGLDSTNSFTIRGPQLALRLPGAPYDNIKIGGVTPCGLFNCWDKINIQLGDGNSDRVTFGTTDVRYANPKTRYWSVRGAEFIPMDEGFTYAKNWVSGLFSASGAFTAPVHLPHGAVINRVSIHIYDDDAANNLTVCLDRSGMDGNPLTMACISTNAASNLWRMFDTLTITEPVVNNNGFSYGLVALNMNGAPTHRLGGVVIEYEVSEPLP